MHAFWQAAQHENNLLGSPTLAERALSTAHSCPLKQLCVGRSGGRHKAVSLYVKGLLQWTVGRWCRVQGRALLVRHLL